VIYEIWDELFEFLNAEAALDRGQIDDWFGSPFTCWRLAIGVMGWIATVALEIRLKEPVIDFRCPANRNFAIASVLFFVFRRTTLIAQIVQSLYGCGASDAGRVLGPEEPLRSCSS
jgi:DHA2 family multidrug resistance protein